MTEKGTSFWTPLSSCPIKANKNILLISESGECQDNCLEEVLIEEKEGEVGMEAREETSELMYPLNMCLPGVVFWSQGATPSLGYRLEGLMGSDFI